MSPDLFGLIASIYIPGAFLAFLGGLVLDDDYRSTRELIFMVVCWPVALVVTVVRGGMEFLSR